MATVTVDETRGPRKSVTLTENDADSARAVLRAIAKVRGVDVSPPEAADIVRELCKGTGGSA